MSLSSLSQGSYYRNGRQTVVPVYILTLEEFAR